MLIHATYCGHPRFLYRGPLGTCVRPDHQSGDHFPDCGRWTAGFGQEIADNILLASLLDNDAACVAGRLDDSRARARR